MTGKLEKDTNKNDNNGIDFHINTSMTRTANPVTKLLQIAWVCCDHNGIV